MCGSCRAIKNAVTPPKRSQRFLFLGSADKEPAASAAAAPTQDVANQQVHPERQAKLPGTAAGLGVGLLVARVAAARALQLVQQILVGVVVRLHRNRRAGLLLRADVVETYK